MSSEPPAPGPTPVPDPAPVPDPVIPDENVYTDVGDAPEDQNIPTDEGDPGEHRVPNVSEPEKHDEKIEIVVERVLAARSALPEPTPMAAEAARRKPTQKKPRKPKPKPKPRAKIVTFYRTIKQGTSGRDTAAVKRALSRAGYMRWTTKWGLIFGPVATAALRKFQSKHGLRADGVYGPSTHKKLAPYYDPYGAQLLSRVPRPKPVDKRGIVVANALWGYNARGAIHYRQWRPIDGFRTPKKLPLYTDCSGFAACCYQWGGLPGFNVYDYTGTESRRGTRVTLVQAQPGDLVFYGPGWPYHHVAVYVGGGRVVSHGSEGGPYLLNATYRGDLAEVRSYL